MAISQSVTVLRLGKVVGREHTANTSPMALAQLMVGRHTVPITRNTNHRSGQTIALEVDRLKLTDKRGVPVLRDVSFNVYAGEIVGVVGVAGNGQSELVSILNGMSRPDSGQVRVNGHSLELGDPRAFYRMKVGRIPEDRLKGIVGELTVAQNLALEHIADFTHNNLLDHQQIQKTASRLIEEFQIKAKPNDRVRTLSGGNIQKIILARTLSQQPTVVIAAQPTRGLDVGATEYVHQKLTEQKARGAAILLVSEDLDEILLLSDHILVIYEGQIVAVIPAETADLHKIGLLMAGGKVSNEA
jgi:simple sugar transport system ATP-binding protein